MKCNRGIGTINKIHNILETLYFGKFYFEVGKTMIESMLLGSILTNIEVAYNLSISEIEKLEKCHEMALRKLLSLPSKSPKPMLYFLTGSTPIRFLVQRRRLVYLHHILNQNEEALIKTFFDHQFETRKQKDWATQILKDLSDFEISSTLSEIKNISEENWKMSVKIKTHKNALFYLNSIIGSKSKTYEELKMAPYLCSYSEEIPNETAKFIAKAQSHMIETVKMNFQGQFKPNFVCISCNSAICDQSHLLYCKSLIGSNQLITYIPDYEDIFNDSDPKEQVFIANILMENLKKKKEIESNI